jgi:NitT/TauT family transport system ATP-binding protein
MSAAAKRTIVDIRGEHIPASPRQVIEVRGASKIYRTRDGDVHSVQPVDFTVSEAEFIVIVGPSGCGKTTLLKMLAGLLPPSTGEVRVEGKVITRPHGNVGIVFQSAMLLPWRSVLRNVMMPIEIKGLPHETYETRAHELLRMTGLTDFTHKFPWQLSGGMQQRVSICRALVHDPKIVLMDEPFGALDAMTRERMNVELKRIQQETRKTVVLITHSIPEAVFLADRVIVMTPRPGKIAAIYDVPLPPDRTLDIMAHPAFTAMTQKLRSHFMDAGID